MKTQAFDGLSSTRRHLSKPVRLQTASRTRNMSQPLSVRPTTSTTDARACHSAAAPTCRRLPCCRRPSPSRTVAPAPGLARPSGSGQAGTSMGADARPRTRGSSRPAPRGAHPPTPALFYPPPPPAGRPRGRGAPWLVPDVEHRDLGGRCQSPVAAMPPPIRDGLPSHLLWCMRREQGRAGRSTDQWIMDREGREGPEKYNGERETRD
jgi:hypothetical protein